MSAILIPLVIALLINVIWIHKSIQEFSVKKYETIEIFTGTATTLTIHNGYRLIKVPNVLII